MSRQSAGLSDSLEAPAIPAPFGVDAKLEGVGLITADVRPKLAGPLKASPHRLLDSVLDQRVA